MRKQDAWTWQGVRNIFHAGVLVLAVGLISPLLGSAQAHAPRLQTVPDMIAAPGDASLVPAVQPYSLPPEKAAKAKTLGAIRTRLHFGSELWQLAVFMLILATGTASRLGDRVAVFGDPHCAALGDCRATRCGDWA